MSDHSEDSEERHWLVVPHRSRLEREARALDITLQEQAEIDLKRVLREAELTDPRWRDVPGKLYRAFRDIVREVLDD